MNSYLLTKMFYRELAQSEVLQIHCTPHHQALFFRIVEIQNEVGWHIKIIGIPTKETMFYSCIKRRETYYKCFNELSQWGIIKLIRKSANIHTATQITLYTDLYDSYTCTENRTASGQEITAGSSTENSTSKEHVADSLRTTKRTAKGHVADTYKTSKLVTLTNEETNQTVETIPDIAAHKSISVKEAKRNAVKAKEKVAPKRNESSAKLNVSSSKLKAADSSQTPTPEILFSQSEFADKDKFKAAFENTDYAHANLDYYYAAVMNWSEGKQAKRRDWIATARQFMLSDFKDGKLVTTNGTAHGKTNHTNGKSPSAKSTDAGVNLDAIFAIIDYTHSQK